ncbi:hypothetical protein [Pseudomonas citri]|uniref:hypothetical protein n=1 Tax=Pseudomonas citri TaxID=2978349 RepID=UPI0021B5F3DC|nr:hypothetical protein [Pseudomonas citri]
MNKQLKFFSDINGTYLGAMGGELLPGSPHPFPEGVEVKSAPNSMSDHWDFVLEVWMQSGGGIE